MANFVGFSIFDRYTHQDRRGNGWQRVEHVSTVTNARAALTPAEAEFARELFEQHQLALYRYLKRVLVSSDDAREILQETYLRLLRQPSFEHVRQNPRAYLFATATNLANNCFRRRSQKSIEAEAEMFEAAGLSSPQWESWPELALQGQQTEALIISALFELPAAMRAALLQHRFQALTHREIALRLGVSERTVERYLKEGLLRIADRLEAGR